VSDGDSEGYVCRKKRWMGGGRGRVPIYWPNIIIIIHCLFTIYSLAYSLPIHCLFTAYYHYDSLA
jgi:hypothetical protein